MAAIQKIRSYGVVLMCVVGLALFAFIAEELVRAISTTRNMGRQVVGEVYGENINYEEFNKLYDEYENMVKLNNGNQSLTDDQATQLRDQVWQEMLTQKLIQHETAELGISVSDAEVQSIINAGTNPILSQTPFTNPATGTFDVNQLKQFLAQYDEIMGSAEYPEQAKEQMRQLMDYWKFVEKQIRQQALAQKYQTLVSACFTSNVVSAQANYEGRVNESSILMAAVPFTAVKAEGLEATDSEIKAKYDEMKTQYPEMFSSQQELRSIKYIAVPINASQADKDALQQELQEYGQALQAENANVANIVRESRSLIPYNGLFVSKRSLPTDVVGALDSMAVGTQSAPYTNFAENTMNLIKYIGHTQQPDSVEFRRIDVVGTDAKAIAQADSILNALKAGEPMDSLAKRYNQAATATWLTSAQVDGAQLNEENRRFINTLFTTAQGQYEKVKTNAGTIIVKVTDRRNIIDKYNVAVIKREIAFSQETATKAYNEFSSFLGANPTLADIEANAVNSGYTVQTTEYLLPNVHYIANIKGTTDALRWIFDKAEEGDVSELYECGEGNNRLLVVMLTDIHEVGDRDINDHNLRDMLKDEVLMDKKAAQLIAQMKDMKNVQEVAKMEGAVQDTIQNITFSAPVFVQKLASSEPALTGAVAAAKKGQFVCPVRGQSGVYAFQVLSQEKKTGSFDKEREEQMLTGSYMRSLNNLINVLVRKADIQDNRYRFYQ